MKRLFIFIPALFLLFHTSLFAGEYTYTLTGVAFKVTTNTNRALIFATNTTNLGGSATISLWKNPLSFSTLNQEPVFTAELTFPSNNNGVTKSFVAENLSPNTTYYLNGNQQTPIKTDPYVYTADSEIATSALVFTPEDGNVVIGSGKIDINQSPNPESSLTARLEYSSQGTFNADMSQSPSGMLVALSHPEPAVQATGINDDGSYYFTLPDIDPVKYWYRLTFHSSAARIGQPVLGTFNGQTGFSPTTVSQVQEDFERRSYRLLAPLPGLSVLLDPDLCREQQIENPGKGYICDINTFINYIFRLLIGIAAVILVIRIIIEGFQYATSDVLKVKIASREKLWQGVWGLLLALTAWLILNTINPRLVENEINIPTLAISAEDYGDFAAPTTLVPTDQMPIGVYCPKSGKGGSIAQIAQSWQGKVEYYLHGSKKDGTSNPGRGKKPEAMSDGKAYLDCSGYVNVVLTCAGYTPNTDFVNKGTTNIFQNADRIKPVTSDTSVTTTSGQSIALQPGDLLGWTSTEGGTTWGHVVIYIGNGMVMESTRVPGNILPPKKLTQYKHKGKLIFLKQIPS